MAHVIEPAASGRAKCRGCGEPIAKDELRLGERLPNPFGEGEMTLWFHPFCGAYKRPEPFLEALEATTESIDEADWLRAEAEKGVAHRRLPRIDGAQPAPTGRARCRCCREPIEKEAWRIGLLYYEDGYFNPSGFIHVGCSQEYFETDDVIGRLKHFSPTLTDGDLGELQSELDTARDKAGP